MKSQESKVFLFSFQSIRELVDPSSLFIEDFEIEKVLRLTACYYPVALRKCALIVLKRALRQKDRIVSRSMHVVIDGIRRKKSVRHASN